MVANRGYDSLDAKSRNQLIDSAAQLLASEGHLAFTARRIADHAKLKPQLVHYYFRSMEELVVAVFHCTNDEYFRQHNEALTAPRPIHAIWRLNRNLPFARLMTEFVALANRYPLLSHEMREAGGNFRALQVAAIKRRYAEREPMPGFPCADALAMLLSAVARNYVIEEGVGLTVGHAQIEAYIDGIIDRIDPA